MGHSNEPLYNQQNKPQKKRPPEPWSSRNTMMDDTNDDDDRYHGCYYERIPHPSHRAETHVILGHLLGPDLIERYDVYRYVGVDANDKQTTTSTTTSTSTTDIVLSRIVFGTRVDGHKGMVHGGILSLLVDDVMGYAFEALGMDFAVTAYLHLNFRKPVPAGASVVLRVRLLPYQAQDQRSANSGRKLYLQAQMTNPEGTVLYVDATSLFIVPKTHYYKAEAGVSLPPMREQQQQQQGDENEEEQVV